MELTTSIEILNGCLVRRKMPLKGLDYLLNCYQQLLICYLVSWLGSVGLPQLIGGRTCPISTLCSIWYNLIFSRDKNNFLNMPWLFSSNGVFASKWSFVVVAVLSMKILFLTSDLFVIGHRPGRQRSLRHIRQRRQLQHQPRTGRVPFKSCLLFLAFTGPGSCLQKNPGLLSSIDWLGTKKQWP